MQAAPCRLCIHSSVSIEFTVRSSPGSLLPAVSDPRPDSESRPPAPQASPCQPTLDPRSGHDQHLPELDSGNEAKSDDGIVSKTHLKAQRVESTTEIASTSTRRAEVMEGSKQPPEPRSDHSIESLSKRPVRQETTAYAQSDDRRKRRKTTPPPEPGSTKDIVAGAGVVEGGQLFDVSPQSHHMTSHHDLAPNGDMKRVHSNDSENPSTSRDFEVAPDLTESPPKKIMKLRGDGKLTSPKPKEPAVMAPPVEKKKRGRKPKATLSPESKSKVAIMRYSTDAADSQASVGESIDSILSGATRFRPPLAEKRTQLKAKPEPAGPPKPVHPLFRSKAEREAHRVAEKAVEEAAKQKAEEKKMPVRTTPRKRTLAQVGPSPMKRASRRGSGNSLPDNERPRLSFGRQAKQAGAWPLPWPVKGAAHVRALEPNEEAPPEARLPRALPPRKLKLSQPHVPEDESVLRIYESTIAASTQAERGSDPPGGATQLDHPRFHAPQRLLLSGYDLQMIMLKQLYVGDVSIHEHLLRRGGPVLPNEGRKLIQHPAVLDLFDKAGTTTSAFDNFTCEDLEWAHKYAPKTLATTLQPAHRLAPLRAWLQGLVVTSTSCADPGAKAGDRPAKRRRRKRKRAAELDDFIVSGDDDDDGGGDEDASDSDDVAQFHAAHPHAAYRQAPLRKLTSAGLAATRAVLVSGPHGCGKTAAVYAIAQELGFEVFEINAGTRRAGRDIWDKIGDMTKNHLVNRQASPVGDGDEAEEPGPDMGQHVQEEIDSGRQSTMKSFFKAAAPKKPGLKASKGGTKRKSDSPKQKPEKPPSHAQKQSLILLEEVDVLFDEDRGFWPTVAELVRDSRRPVILTCTDESLVPAAELAGLAVLRLVPPPSDLAADYLLLLAACEGHRLERAAVRALYRVRRADLRAACADLALWCQMALGDPKRGLGWMLLRGADGAAGSDARGGQRPLRAISDGTYMEYMGVLPSADSRGPRLTSVEAEVALLADVLDGRADFDVDAWLAGPPTAAAPPQPQPQPQSQDRSPTPQRRRAALRYLDLAADAASLADLVWGEDPSSHRATALDPTVPAPTAAARLNCLDGLPLLHAPPHEEPRAPRRALALTLRVMARNLRAGSPAWSSPTHGTLGAPTTTDPHALAAHIVAPPPRTLEQTQHATHAAMAAAFPLLAAPPEGRAPGLSVLDGPLAPIATDVAPYARAVVHFDLRLERQRLALSGLLSQQAHRGGSAGDGGGGGGGPGGGGNSGVWKPRTTRASRAALEGGCKARTRRERWFPAALPLPAVLRTGGEGWQEVLLEVLARDAGGGPGPRRSSAAAEGATLPESMEG